MTASMIFLNKITGQARARKVLACSAGKRGAMAVLRVKKCRDYTVMSNVHLKDQRLSLKTKGLLSVILSLPDDWEYSIAGLVSICKENETAVKTALKELKDCGYLTITKLMPGQTKSGRIEYVYNIYETPAKKQEVEKQGVDFLPLEFQPLENHGQLNTDISSTNKSNTDDIAPAPREQKHRYGKYHHVLLTDAEHQNLQEKLGENMTQDCIVYLDAYIEEKGYKAKRHYLSILRWVTNAVKEQQRRSPSKNAFNQFQQNQYDFDKLENILSHSTDAGENK